MLAGERANMQNLAGRKARLARGELGYGNDVCKWGKMLQVGRIFGSRGSATSCYVRLVESFFLGREGCELAKGKEKTGKWGDGDVRLVARGRQVRGDVGANLVGAREGQ